MLLRAPLATSVRKTQSGWRDREKGTHPSEVWWTAAPASPPQPPGRARTSSAASFIARLWAAEPGNGASTICGVNTRPWPSVLVVVRNEIGCSLAGVEGVERTDDKARTTAWNCSSCEERGIVCQLTELRRTRGSSEESETHIGVRRELDADLERRARVLGEQLEVLGEVLLEVGRRRVPLDVRAASVQLCGERHAVLVGEGLQGDEHLARLGGRARDADDELLLGAL